MALPSTCLLPQEHAANRSSKMTAWQERDCFFTFMGLPEQLDDRLANVASGAGNVFETAAKRIIMPNRSVIDPEGGINCGGDIFCIYRPVFGPTRDFDVLRVVSGLAEDEPAANASTGHQSGVHKIMIPSLLGGDVSDGPS